MENKAIYEGEYECDFLQEENNYPDKFEKNICLKIKRIVTYIVNNILRLN